MSKKVVRCLKKSDGDAIAFVRLLGEMQCMENPMPTDGDVSVESLPPPTSPLFDKNGWLIMNKSKDTVLHIAARRGFSSIVHYLTSSPSRMGVGYKNGLAFHYWFK
eukprot:m.70461 g.70461  ORF g.70461 m.70461 type:complete len:106 (+) comp11667_c0_seq1:39-356(+)